MGRKTFPPLKRGEMMNDISKEEKEVAKALDYYMPTTFKKMAKEIHKIYEVKECKLCKAQRKVYEFNFCKKLRRIKELEKEVDRLDNLLTQYKNVLDKHLKWMNNLDTKMNQNRKDK